jgi:hypothetical protein
MQSHRYALIAAIALGALPVSAGFAADESDASSSISDHWRAIGAATARESKAFGAAVKEGAQRVGTATKKVAHQVADASVKGAHEVGAAAKGVAAKTKSAVKRESPERDKKPAP